MRLVCFDLGRVLVRISESLGDAFERAGLGAHRELVELRMKDADLRKAMEAQVHALEHGHIEPPVFCAAVGSMLGIDAADIARMLDAFIHGAYPGATALLDDLKRHGERIACLSNTNARHWELMEKWLEPADRVIERIDLHYASHELGLRKPAPEIYEALETRAGVAGTDVVFFDDLPDNVAAARSRGWDAVLVVSREDPITEIRAALTQRGLL